MSHFKIPYGCSSMAFLNQYYDKKFPEVLESDDQYKLIEEAQSGNIASQNKLVESLLKFIYNEARSNWRPNTELDDLFQVGVIGCIKAIMTFKINLDVKFLTYARPVISNEIKKYIRTLKLHIELVSLSSPLFISDNGDEVYLLDLLYQDDFENNVEKYVELIMIKELLLSELDKLSDRDRTMIEYRFGLNGKPQLTNEKIGKIYGCSRQYINKLTNITLQGIRRNIEFSLH